MKSITSGNFGDEAIHERQHSENLNTIRSVKKELTTLEEKERKIAIGIPNTDEEIVIGTKKGLPKGCHRSGDVWTRLG